MINLNAGVMRRAMNKTRAGNLADATTLIQKTLRQHGLAGGLESAASRPDTANTPSSFASHRKTFKNAAGSRAYVLHVLVSAAKGVLLMLHGCTQTPEDFAMGTNIVETAHKHGLIVVLPAQSRGDNAQSCWNWFSRGDQLRGRGEPAILAGLTQDIARQYSISTDHTYVAGLSAGGAMAVVLGQTYPNVFAGIAVHSGLPYACARSVNEAFAAMGGKSARGGVHVTETVPTIVFHGTADHTVAHSNGSQIITDTLGASSGQQTQIVNQDIANGRQYTQTLTLRDTGAPLTEYWEIEGLGHAWSGGNARGSHTDPKGPDASAEMIRFFQSLSTVIFS